MKAICLRHYFPCLYFLAALLTPSVYGQTVVERLGPPLTGIKSVQVSNQKSPEDALRYIYAGFVRYYKKSGNSFDKSRPERTEADISPLRTFSLSASANDSSGGKIRPGRIAMFVAIGSISGFFFGVATGKAGGFNIIVFHLKPALIGAGIGAVLSFLVPDNNRKKKKASDTAISSISQ